MAVAQEVQQVTSLPEGGWFYPRFLLASVPEQGTSPSATDKLAVVMHGCHARRQPACFHYITASLLALHPLKTDRLTGQS